MAKEGYRISFLDKSSGSSPEKDLIPKPDTYQLTHDASLGKRLDVGDSSQIHPYQLPSDVGLENYDSHYSQNLSLHGSIGKRPQRNKNYREYSTKPSNNMKATTSHSCGDLLTSLSNPDSSTGRLLKLSSDTDIAYWDIRKQREFDQEVIKPIKKRIQTERKYPCRPEYKAWFQRCYRQTSHVATVLRQLLELVDKHWNGSGSLLLNKKFLGPARDLLLTLVVPAPSQQWCRSHPEDTSKTFHRREMELKETGQLVPNDMESLKQKLVRVLEENLILSEKIQRLEEGATTSTVSGHPSHTYDDLLRKNQQLNMQVSCLNQELAQLKKLEETVTLLHESQRSLVVTNEYLLQQLNKEQKGYSGKALLPPEKSHHLGRSSPFGKSMLSSSSPVAHDMGQYLIQTVSDSVPEPSLWS
ncbi:LRRC36 [Cervus elaphus hippelaphus]|uniref:LRRC36 n=1 Tax=Cervus elaphus hippelaphus TaxID=46360 RepID=A0A212DDF6_CEREH|nr:LRRC36 [Cervus elaphus hippelaphus]